MDDADQEQLRRRRYAPGASQADIEAYHAVEPHPSVPVLPGAPAGRWGGIRAGAVGAAIALAAVGVVAVALLHPLAPAPPAPSRSTAAVDAGEVAMPASARAAFLRAFDSDDRSGPVVVYSS